MEPQWLLNALAHAFLSGEQTEPAIRERARYMLGRDWPWLRPVIRRYVHQQAMLPGVARRIEIAEFISSSRFFRFAWRRFRSDLTVQSWVATPAARRTIAAWGLPSVENVSALCHWLAIDFDHLQWFADLNRYGYSSPNPKLENYNYRVLHKPGGSVRLIESPKKTVKELQRRILNDLLGKVPPHPAAHGFVRGRSIKTFVAPHTGRDVVLRMDLQNFFPSVGWLRVAQVFRTFGYSDSVAEYLSGLCTNAAPRRLWQRLQRPSTESHELWSMYARRHLPQGAPTSPALANVCAYHLDRRLTALAKAAGANYTRYADDLGFSGDAAFSRRAERFAAHVAAVVLEEGFAVNHRKTRLMRRSVRQHLAGLTINRHANINRREFDTLKAILTHCIRNGPSSQNREVHPDFRSHLAGRIGFVEMINPSRGAKLRSLFAAITWPASVR
jgi:hypothetical protein